MAIAIPNFGMNPMMNMGCMNPMLGMGNPFMMQMMIGMQMMQLMQMMQMLMGQMGGGFPGGMPGMSPMPMGDMMGNSLGFPPQFSPPMQFPGYGAPPYGGQAPWGGGYPYSPPSYGGPQAPWSNAPMAAPGDFRGSGFGNAVARSAANVVSSNWSPGGYCYRGVKRALAPLGVNLHGGSAYQAADQLARNPRFREVQVPRDRLRSLPPGAVVVWNRNPGAGKEHGHISISLGNGMEASDKLRRQITGYPSSYRVFIPNGQ
jgi:hypothetical protein